MTFLKETASIVTLLLSLVLAFLNFAVEIFIIAYIFKRNFCPAKANALTSDHQDMKQCLCGIDTAELAIITVQTFPTCTPLSFTDYQILLHSQMVLRRGIDNSLGEILLETPAIIVTI